MRTVTQDYIDEIHSFGKQIDSKVIYTLNGVETELGATDLNSVSLHYEGALLKSVMKQLDIDSNVEIPLNTILEYQFGVLVDGEYEYTSFGQFVVYKVEKQEDTRSYKITCYDKMLYAMKDYESVGITYPCTIKQYITILCMKMGLVFKNVYDEFANQDRVIPNELFLASNGNSLGYTFRDVLDQLAQVTASTICIDDNGELELRYLTNTNKTIDETYLKDINVNFGEKYGPVNVISLSRSADSDIIYYPTTLPQDICELKIVDNQFMNGNDRVDYIEDIYNVLNGLEYYINDFSSPGITFLDLCDKYNISIGNNTYNCIMLNDEINVTQGLEENIHTDMMEEAKTDYKKADKTDRRINETWIIVNKVDGEITALASDVTTMQDELGNVYTIDQVNTLVQTAETGVTNTFSEAGGNNIFRNTGLWFENNDSDTNQQNPYEFWTGQVVRSEDIDRKASNRAIMSLQNGTLSQAQQVTNGNYTVSFKYKKLVDLANVSVVINGIETELTATEDTEVVSTIAVSTNKIEVSFISDTNNACEIYDLMVNAGKTKLAYSQNQNETTTDTVNISKGIEITSSETNTKFRADTDGIRIYNTRTNEKTSEYTETGTETNTLEVKDEATILQVKWQLVGDQTWLTRL